MDILITGRSAALHDVTITTAIALNPIDYDDIDVPKSRTKKYDMVWCKGCPIYGPFDPGTDPRTGDLTRNTFNAAWRVLKVGGIFVMPLSPILIKRSSLEEIKIKANELIVGPSSKHWSMESTEIEKMLVYVEPTEPAYEHALVFTKTIPMKGGSRQPRKTMRRRHRR
jgi:hypothetical protein